jgi:phage-related minor tail protein
MARASARAELEILIAAKDKTTRALRDVRESIEDISDSTKKSEKSIGILDVAMGGFIANAVSGIAGTLIGALSSIPMAILETSSAIRESNTKIRQSFGMTSDEAEVLNESVKTIWREGFSDMETANEAVIAVRQNFKNLAGEELTDTARGLMVISEVFGEDVTGSANAAATLMKQFGLTSQQSLDFLATGFQEGLDVSDDFIDSVGEYSNQFAEAGFSAEEFFSIMQTGVAGGNLGTDKVADAIKELHIRLHDGSDTTREALEELYLAMQDPAAVEALENGIADVSGAMLDAKDDIERITDELSDQKDQAKGLEAAIKGARTQLKFLTQVETTEVAAFSREIERLELRMKEMRLEGLDLEKGSPGFDAHKAAMDALSTEIDRLNLQRDLQIAKQDEAIAKITEEEGHTLSFAQLLQEITAQQGHIEGLSSELTSVQASIRNNKIELELANQAFEKHKDILEGLEMEYDGMMIGASEMLAAIADGSINTADVLPQLIEMLRQVDDQIALNEIGVGLFGNQWEDMTAKGILGIDQTKSNIDDMTGRMGAMVEAGITTDQELTEAWRNILEALAPIGDMIHDLMTTNLLPLAQEVSPLVAEWIGENLPDAVMVFKNTLAPIIADVLPFLIKLLGTDAVESTSSLSSWFRDLNRAIQFLSPVGDFIKGVFDIVISVFELVISVIDGLIGLIVTLVAVLSGAITPTTAVKNVFREFKRILMAVLKVVGQLATKILGLFQIKPPGWLTSWAGGGKPTTGAAANVLATVGKGALSPLDSISKSIPPLPNPLRTRPPKKQVVGKLSPTGFAEGGDFIGGKPILVGERGPELLLPRGGGTVIPNDRLRGGGGSISLVVNGDVEGERTLQRIEGALHRAIDTLLTQGSL